jgi:hypothetical protein
VKTSSRCLQQCEPITLRHPGFCHNHVETNEQGHKNVDDTFFTGKRASWWGHETDDLRLTMKAVLGGSLMKTIMIPFTHYLTLLHETYMCCAVAYMHSSFYM